MNISQVETLLDMTRANIRFYEQEGLVCPRREKNGYRDYAEEDVETLRKIKLLRQLGLPLETIRRVQAGELPLSEALSAREAQLAAEQSELEWAQRVCRRMRADGAEYPALDAQRYLEELDRPADGAGPFGLERDALPTVAHPWRRYFARSLDLGLYGLLWGAVRLLLLRWNPDRSLLVTLLEDYLSIGLMLLVEPLLLCTLGTTPGKALFGLVIRDRDGRKLTWRAAMARTWGVFCRGMGYGVPFYQLYRNYKCCRTCEAGEAMEWEADASYQIRDASALRCLGYVAARGAMAAAAVLIVAQAFLPIHRGPLTPEQYAANVNDMIGFLGVDMAERLEPDGTWREPDDGEFTINVWFVDAPEHRLTVTDGQVTGVRIEIEQAGEQIVFAPTVQEQLAAVALCAAQKSYSALSWGRSGVMDAIAERGLESYTLQARGVTITQTVEQRGYLDSGTQSFLFAEEGAEPYFHLVFTLEKAE